MLTPVLIMHTPVISNFHKINDIGHLDDNDPANFIFYVCI